MASIEQRGEAYRVVWRNAGQKEYTTWPALTYAEEACAIVEGHRGRITAERVYVDMGVLESDTPSSTAPTLRAWCDEWLPSRTRVTPGTMAAYRQQLRDHIYPAFGDTPVDRITPISIGAWLNQLRDGSAKNTTITRYYSLLHGALEAAVRHRLIVDNPCRLTDFVRDQRHDTDTGEHHAVYLTPQEYQMLRAAFPRAWWPLLDFFAGTGARWSEATALAVEHVVAPTARSGPKVRIWRAWKRRGDGPGLYLGTTKGRSKREIGIDLELYESLLPLIEGHAKSTLVFRSSTGSALDYGNSYKQVWKPALARARRCPEHPPQDQGERREGAQGRCGEHGGVRADGQPCGARVVPEHTRCKDHLGPRPDAVSECDCPGALHVEPSWHDLRHTHAAWLFSDPNVTPLAISRRLGHAQLATTSEIYGDLMPDAEEAAVAAITAARNAGRAGS